MNKTSTAIACAVVAGLSVIGLAVVVIVATPTDAVVAVFGVLALAGLVAATWLAAGSLPGKHKASAPPPPEAKPAPDRLPAPTELRTGPSTGARQGKAAGTIVPPPAQVQSGVDVQLAELLASLPKLGTRP